MNQSDRLTAALDGRYRIERELGRGGMATVYLADDIKHHRQVAIKVLHPHLSAVIGHARFLKEITTTAQLQHPHILPLFDSGEADGLLFYVMPFVAGESLRDRLARERRLPVADAIAIASEVASALEHAHRHGVIHRDIKPANILLHEGSALVADFGIALAPDSGETRLTETGLSIGTPEYMSPEQALGDRQLDARTDIYATGAMLYEMLVGAPPFSGVSSQAIVAKVLTEAPTLPSRLRHDLTAQLDTAVLTALQKDPAHRYASAAAFQAALTAMPVAPAVRVRARWIAGTAIVVALLLAALFWPRRHEGARVASRRRAPDTAAVRLAAVAAEFAGRRDPDNCAKATSGYSAATEKDTTYAEAWGGLAETNVLCALFGAEDPSPRFASARAEAGEALMLDSTLSIAYTARGLVHLFHDQDWAGAQHDFTRAIRFDSTAYEPSLFRAWYYLAMNQVDSAVISVERARILAPIEPIVGVRLATVRRYAGDLPGAERELTDVLDQHPENPLALQERFEIDASLGRCGAQRRGVEASTASRMEYIRANVAYSEVTCGERPPAQHLADSLTAVAASGRYVDLFSLGVIYAALGNKDAALRTLDAAVTQHNWALFFLRHHFAFKDYQEDPRFIAIRQRAGVR